MATHVIVLCKDLFPKWTELNESCFSVETVLGGITNLLLKVSVKEENVSIIVRFYGPKTDYVINRKRDLQAIKYLSVAGFGAKLLDLFGNGMVQSFIHACTLTPSDMRKPKLASEIAKQLRWFHQVEVPGIGGVGSSRSVNGFKSSSSSVDWMGREMLEMRLRDKVENDEDRYENAQESV
ncbi:probable ethanolamine kinase [Hibiscus syriacus]|uniref:probable ethanolamine kinase n=1 Tax=Hibiscus syriacus TaxID=106335 RepID=UPI001921869B|nr:probable ethanolamine kinase [Hibiscus syriacus]